MTVEEAIKTRKSVRSYMDRDVDMTLIRKLLEAARLAPSASNRQEGRFVVVTDPAVKKRLASAASNQSFVGEAGAVIACCAETDNHRMRCGQPCYPIDLAIQIDHMTLRAVELGLGTCWIGSFSEDKVKSILSIPNQIRVVELLTVGYPADPSPVAKRRLDLADIGYSGSWGAPLTP